jgi:predicted metal-binding protein
MKGESTTMIERERVEALFSEHDCGDFKWIQPEDIVVAQWVRMKCMYGCRHYGKSAACPPNVPPVAECERLFSEYNEAAIFHFEGGVDKPEDRHKWTKKINGRLLKLERAVFLSGYHKALVLFVDPCNLCEECPDTKADCLNPQNARPAPEGMAVDVFATARRCGFPIQVLDDYSQKMNRYGLLLIE